MTEISGIGLADYLFCVLGGIGPQKETREMKGKPTIQKIGVAAMLFAMLGFAVFRLLRIDLAPRRRVVITYDSNLRDKIVERTPEPSTRLSREQYSEIVDRLKAVEDEMDSGDDEGSLSDLRKLMDSDGRLRKDDPGSLPARYVYVENGVRSVERAFSEGHKGEARRLLSDLLEDLDHQNGAR
jgi:hypothetical protein